MDKIVSAGRWLALPLIACTCIPVGHAQDAGALLHAIADHATQKLQQRTAASDAPATDAAQDAERRPMLHVGGGTDFTPAPVTLFQDNFAATPIGAMPRDWKTNGSGQVVSVQEVPGKWLALQGSATYKLAVPRNLPARFTVEFDLVAAAESPRDAGNPSFGFAKDNGVSEYTPDGYNNGALNGVTLIFGNAANGAVMVGSAASGFDATPPFDLRSYANRLLHVTIAVDGDREQVYLDHTRIVDTRMFRGNPSRYFFISGPVSYQHGAQVLFGNFRIGGYQAPTAATGSAPLPPPIVKQPANPQRPTLKVVTENGRSFDLAAQRGKWVLVNYWATWCPPCTASLPAISSFVAVHADVAAIGVATAATQPRHGDVTAYAQEHPLDFPLAWIDTDQAQRLLGTSSAIPVTWLIAPDGTLVRTWTGQFDAAELGRIMQAAGYGDKAATPS